MIVVFDLDGTLLNTLADISQAANAALNLFDPSLQPFSEEETKRMIGDGARVLLQRMLAARGICNNEVALSKAHDLFIQMYAQRLADNTVPYPGVMDGLARIRAGFPQAVMCICTNKPHELAVQLVKQSPIAQYFQPIEMFITGAKPGVSKKPNAEHLLHAIEQTGNNKPSRILMVGDGRNDILVARNVENCSSVGVTFGFGEEEEIRNLEPDYIAHTFDEATQRILAWLDQQ